MASRWIIFTSGWMILIVIVCLVIIGFIASEFRHIAAKKGYDEAKYFWWSFFFTFVGWMMVVALPDRGKATVTVVDTPDTDELPDL